MQIVRLFSTAIPVLLYFMALLVLASLVSIMITFMGGRHVGADGLMLLEFQRIGSVVAALLVGAGLTVFVKDKWGQALRQLWLHIPGWQLFAFLLLNLLAISGEVSFWFVASESDWLEDEINHMSLIALSLSSLAFLTLSAAGHVLAGKPPYSKARW